MTLHKRKAPAKRDFREQAETCGNVFLIFGTKRSAVQIRLPRPVSLAA